MTARRSKRVPRPLDESALQEVAVAYVGRFATTRAKLRTYLSRKIRERGWEGRGEPDLAALADRLADQGYIDDSAYAESKARSLTARGYGKRRVAQVLRGAGIADEDGEEARRHSEEQAVASVVRFAERRRIGPFAAEAADPKARERAIAAMVRAGHSFDLARAVAGMVPGSAVDFEELSQIGRRGSV
jgi:regulatory protein